MSEAEEKGWQPIETAPKDGTTVLLWDRDVDHHENARWSNSRRCWHKPEWGHAIDDEPPASVSRDEMAGVTVYLPTHWMTLPKPPLDTEKTV